MYVCVWGGGVCSDRECVGGVCSECVCVGGGYVVIGSVCM